MILINGNLKESDDDIVTISAYSVTFNLTNKRLAIEKMKEQLVLAGRESYVAGHMSKKPCSANPSPSTTGLIF